MDISALANTPHLFEIINILGLTLVSIGLSRLTFLKSLPVTNQRIFARVVLLVIFTLSKFLYNYYKTHPHLSIHFRGLKFHVDNLMDNLDDKNKHLEGIG